MEEIQIAHGLTKKQQYEELLPQIYALVGGEKDVTANLANICAALKQTFNWWWIGLYLVKDNELVLGPFQGPVACTRIAKGKGVCGSSWQQKQTLIVPDVELFPGHIACSGASRSEIVVPVISNNEVLAVIDADSEHLAHYDETDRVYLEKLALYIANQILTHEPETR